jgi:hypothetical protein
LVSTDRGLSSTRTYWRPLRLVARPLQARRRTTGRWASSSTSASSGASRGGGDAGEMMTLARRPVTGGDDDPGPGPTPGHRRAARGPQVCLLPSLYGTRQTARSRSIPPHPRRCSYPPFYAEDPVSTCRKILHWKTTLKWPADRCAGPHHTPHVAAAVTSSAGRHKWALCLPGKDGARYTAVLAPVRWRHRSQYPSLIQLPAGLRICRRSAWTLSSRY